MVESKTIDIAKKVVEYFKLIGFIPITIINDKSVTKPMDMVYLLGSISFGVFICIYSIHRRQDLVTSNSEIADKGNFMTFFMSIVISIISMISGFVFRHKIWNLVIKLYMIEQKVYFW